MFVMSHLNSETHYGAAFIFSGKRLYGKDYVNQPAWIYISIPFSSLLLRVRSGHNFGHHKYCPGFEICRSDSQETFLPVVT